MTEALNTTQNFQLEVELRRPTHAELVHKLIRLANEHDDFANLLFKLLVPADEPGSSNGLKRKSDSDADSEVEVKSESARDTKKARIGLRLEDVATCKQCDAVFDTKSNEHDSCVHHDVHLDFNKDAPGCNDIEWWDFDEDVEESIWMRLEWPQFFLWDCCDKDGESPGCKRTPHSDRGSRSMYADLQE